MAYNTKINFGLTDTFVSINVIKTTTIKNIYDTIYSVYNKTHMRQIGVSFLFATDAALNPLPNTLMAYCGVAYLYRLKNTDNGVHIILVLTSSSSLNVARIIYTDGSLTMQWYDAATTNIKNFS